VSGVNRVSAIGASGNVEERKLTRGRIIESRSDIFDQTELFRLLVSIHEPSRKKLRKTDICFVTLLPIRTSL